MLDHLKRRVVRILALTKTATLSTSGPAGIQARQFPCEAIGLAFYLLLPGTSDHLLNLEIDPFCVVSTPGWQLRGRAEILPIMAGPDSLMLTHQPAAVGCVLVKIQPLQLQIYRQNGWGFLETIDIEPDHNHTPDHDF